MYLGRIVAIGLTPSGRTAAMYRVSSRSFPNRQAVKTAGAVAVLPRPGFEDDLKKNPYITYNCCRIAGDFVVVSNGSQTDPIAEKIAMGYPVRDAMTLGLLAMDYEKDHLDTPRIVGAVHRTSPVGFLGIVRKDAVLVREFALTPGRAQYISTYECNRPCDENVDGNFSADDVDAVCAHVVSGSIFASFEHPVTAAAALAEGDHFAFSTLTV